MRKFATIFTHLDSIHLTKDVGMLPMAFSKERGYEKSILFYWRRTRSSPAIVAGEYESLLEIFPITAKFKFIYFFKLILALCSQKVSDVNLYHLSSEVYILSPLLKFLRFKMLLKLDLDKSSVEKLLEIYSRHSITKYFRTAFLNLFDYVLIESSPLFDQAKMIWPNANLLYFPNGILQETIPSAIELTKYNHRDNKIIVVGRIGAYQKNHELILKALSIVKDIGSWKVEFIGPVDNTFKIKFDRFLLENPLLKGKVELLGNKSRHELFEIYSKTRIFLMTSRYEGSSLAILEAAMMGCFIITTEIGGADEVTDFGRLGILINQDDPVELADKLLGIFRSDDSVEKTYLERRLFVKEHYNLSNILLRSFNDIR